MKILTTILIGLGAVGCQTGFNRDSMNSSLQADPILGYDDADVLRVEQARPQLQFPIRLAVAFQATVDRWGYGERSESDGQRKEIRAWGDKLRDAGLVSDLFILPDILTGQTRSQNPVKDLRVAAARLQADALLILRSATDVDSYSNPLAVLDLTIVGMFLAPGHQKDALTIVEGIVIDNRNQYVYFAGSAEGLGSTFGPLAVVNDRDAVRDSRREALRSFGELLLKEAQRMRDWVPGPRYPSPGQR